MIDVGGSHAGNAYEFFRLHALASRLVADCITSTELMINARMAN